MIGDVIMWCIFSGCLIVLYYILIQMLSYEICGDSRKLPRIINNFLIFKPLRILRKYIFKPIFRFLRRIYIKLFLTKKINRIIKEIKAKKEFRECFCDINEVKNWNIKQIKSWKLG